MGPTPIRTEYVMLKTSLRSPRESVGIRSLHATFHQKRGSVGIRFRHAITCQCRNRSLGNPRFKGQIHMRNTAFECRRESTRLDWAVEPHGIKKKVLSIGTRTRITRTHKEECGSATPVPPEVNGSGVRGKTVVLGDRKTREDHPPTLGEKRVVKGKVEGTGRTANTRLDRGAVGADAPMIRPRLRRLAMMMRTRTRTTTTMTPRISRKNKVVRKKVAPGKEGRDQPRTHPDCENKMS